MKLRIAGSTTDVSLVIYIMDTRDTEGGGLTGVVYNAAGLTCYYDRVGSAAAQLNLANVAVAGAHTDGGFIEIDSTNMPGWYRLDLSDAIVTAGINSVGVHLKGAENMEPLALEIQIK